MEKLPYYHKELWMKKKSLNDNFYKNVMAIVAWGKLETCHLATEH